MLAGGGVAHILRAAVDSTPPTINGVTDITTDATSGCGQSFCATVDYPITASDPDNTPDQITINCNTTTGSVHTAGMVWSPVRRTTRRAISRCLSRSM